MLNKLKNLKILITAGPTREYLDPVRFISNESSGKMGYAIADLLHKNGADVTLISGSVSINSNLPIQNITQVKTANEMFEACKTYFNTTDVAIFSAAVADYRPKFKSDCKIKKTAEVSMVEFIKNVDLALEFGKVKNQHQISIGFALETNNVLENATLKLQTKNFDSIIINSPKEGEGFGFDTNKISILNKKGNIKIFPMKSKQEVAIDIVNELIELI
ncbi:MAG: phosphopantothenoylcysteine decarboxylase [Lutibacter sp.]|nr:phosphopantothenoylcysteine decarboxylase [Lutibacter sp.]MDT8416290.1 phosphopantothenoylcysteine decarboxylase [Lutibacter sp.]